MLWINNIVDGILDTYNTNSPYQLCRDFNIYIEKVEPNSVMLFDLNSVYYRNYYGNEVIFIRDDLYGREEDFILRHEIGHALLHTDINCSKYTNLGKLERQADYFALALTGIKLDIFAMEGMTLKQIASCVEVPYEPLAQLVNL